MSEMVNSHYNYRTVRAVAVPTTSEKVARRSGEEDRTVVGGIIGIGTGTVLGAIAGAVAGTLLPAPGMAFFVPMGTMWASFVGGTLGAVLGQPRHATSGWGDAA